MGIISVEDNMSNIVVEASRLLDFNQSLDVKLLDNVIGCMYNGMGEQQRIAQEILTTFKEHPESWTRVDFILEYSENQQTKYYALQILEQVINTRWKVLPPDQCEGIKKYIVGVIIKLSSTQESLEREKVYLNKLNMILVQIIKREWPKNWKSFIPDIVGASKTNESMCQNNMVILKLLSEEVFDFSSGQMTQAKAKHLKDTMCSEFQQIFLLCLYVMFLVLPLFRNVTLKCLTEIAGVTVPHYDEAYTMMFSQVIAQLEDMLPLSTNISEAYAQGQDADQQFIQNLALFLCTFLKERGSLVERKQLNDALLKALNYLLLISEVDDTEILKICLEYWNSLASDLYRESPFYSAQNPSPLYLPKPNTRRQSYQSILTQVRVLMISRMAKPEEVLVVENEQGEVVREFMKDTDSINMYKNMRETLVYLTHLDYNDTERIMTDKLTNQVNGTEWSWRNLNTLCWAVASISGAMPEDDEKRFLVIIIKELLSLCEQKRGKDNKAIIASNIMYIVGQYPRFLRQHWRFLKTVINKLFEFMHETHEGVQDMACDTFIKIAQRCRKQFVQIQSGEAIPFIEEILTSISSIICDLQPPQVMSENICNAVSVNGDVVFKQPLIKAMGVVKKETLRLISGWISKAEDHNMVLENFIPPLMEAVLLEYERTPIPTAREPEVLATVATIINKLESSITSEVPKILDAVFQCTLDMINKDFEEFPEHRTNFFLLLQAVNSHCFPALLNIPQPQFKLVLDSINWAFKHSMRNVAETGLQILSQLLRNITNTEQSTEFFRNYYTDILQHVFSVVTDSTHTSSLTMHSSILAFMFYLVEQNRIRVSLDPVIPSAAPESNLDYVKGFVANLLKAVYPHLKDNLINVTVQGMINLDQDIPAFKEHLRDFLVHIREATGDDSSDLYLEEREEQLKKAQEEKWRVQLSVPGILNPYELPEDMQD